MPAFLKRYRLRISGITYARQSRIDEGWMIETDTAIRFYVTKPKIFDEAIHFRARRHQGAYRRPAR
jgi:hypothetical protein